MDEPMKILLHDRGLDVETPWALPVPSPPDRRFVRLDNVPFLHAKPTFGDVVEVRRTEDQPGFWSWDAAGRSYDEICAGLVADGGRYALILDYECDRPDAFGALSAWARGEADLVCEGCSAPRDGKPGRLYVAAPYAVSVADVVDAFARNPHGFTFALVHPR